MCEDIKLLIWERYGGPTCALLRFDQSRGSLHTHNQAARDLGVKSAAVAGFLHAKNSLDPSDDFMGRGVCRFVQIDETSPGWTD